MSKPSRAECLRSGCSVEAARGADFVPPRMLAPAEPPIDERTEEAWGHRVACTRVSCVFRGPCGAPKAGRV